MRRERNIFRIIEGIQAILADEREGLDTPLLFLDPQSVRHIYQELTGMRTMPRLYPRPELETGDGPGWEVGLEIGPGLEAPMALIYRAMRPLIQERIPLVESKDELNARARRFALIEGLLETTHFPDGGLNLEVLFHGVRGVLFYNEEFFSSIIRPVLGQDRFYSLSNQVEMLAYVQGPMQRTIFYHPSYGDDKEHDWVPLTPVVIDNINPESDL